MKKVISLGAVVATPDDDRKITVLYLTNQFTGHGNIAIILGGGLTQNYFLNQTNPHPTSVCPQTTAALVEPSL